MTPDEIIDEMKGQLELRRPRTYVGGLLPAFCDFLAEMGTPEQSFADFEDFIGTHPLVTVGTSTLTVERNGDPKDVMTIRPAYNRIHNFYLFQEKRIGYPRSEPYATGKWADYRNWLDALVTFSAEQLQEVRQKAVDHMLSVLEKREFDPSKVVIDPPVFLMRAHGRSIPSDGLRLHTCRRPSPAGRDPEGQDRQRKAEGDRRHRRLERTAAHDQRGGQALHLQD